MQHVAIDNIGTSVEAVEITGHVSRNFLFSVANLAVCIDNYASYLKKKTVSLILFLSLKCSDIEKEANGGETDEPLDAGPRYCTDSKL